MSTSALHPVSALRDHIHRLETAMTECAKDPGVRRVHRLRTETRRVEALLALLARMKNLPEYQEPARKLLRGLGRLRRAAGTVRDLDVHRDQLEALAAEAHQLPELATPNTSERKASTEAAPAGKNAPGPEMEEIRALAVVGGSIEKLMAQMDEERPKAAAALQATLQKRQARTQKAAKNVLKALETAEKAVLSPKELLILAESIQRQDKQLRERRLNRLKEDQLHDLRKANKAARYVAEIAPGNPVLREAARRFESLQEAGGAWHDSLELERASRKRFGARNGLAALYRIDRKFKLSLYRKALLEDLQRAAQDGRTPPGKTPRERAGAHANGTKRAVSSASGVQESRTPRSPVNTRETPDTERRVTRSRPKSAAVVSA